MDFELLDMMDTPYIWINENGTVKQCNRAASTKIGADMEGRLWADVCQSLPQGYIYHLHEMFLPPHAGVLVECAPDANPQVAAEVQRLQARNEQLELIFNASFDEMFVVDGNGVTLMVNETAERLYGCSSEQLIGKNVLDLERERVFYPSVTPMVLRERKRVTVLQTTREGRRLITTANPVFDDDGRIVYVISNAKDVTELPESEWSARGSQSEFLRSQPENPRPAGLVAVSEAMNDVLRLVNRVAGTDASVLLLGETGVGKNRIAELLHSLSARNAGPCVDINCAALPEGLLESELFGYERGAFTGAHKDGKAGKVELADGGTLFLNEIGELPLHLQGKLLDFIQQRTFSRVGGMRTLSVNTRIIAATNRDLEKMVSEGQFRADLYYRLNVVPIMIPPLRNRTEDIPVLAEVLLSRYGDRYPGSRKRLSAAALRLMSEYEWPGNIRQLENLMERLSLTVEDDTILPFHLPFSTDDKSVEVRTDEASGEGLTAQLARLEREIYARAHAQYGTTYAIADALQVSQPTVVRKLKQYGLGKG